MIMRGRRRSPDLSRGYRFREIVAQTPSSDILLPDGRPPGSAPVVVKVLRLVATTDDKQLFAAGNRLAAELDHPNLVRVLGTGRLRDGRPWVAMPYYRRRSLADQLAAGQRLSTRDVLHIGIRLADVLTLLHVEAQAVHRDVKPANVLVAADGEPVLGDLHVAGLMRPDTGSLTTDRRSLRYSAPEVRELSRYSVQSELYSFAVTLVELLTGENPFLKRADEDAEAFTARWAAARLPPTMPMPAPPNFGALLVRMLAASPNDRPRTAAEVAAALRDVQHELGLRVTPPTPSVRRRATRDDNTLAPPADRGAGHRASRPASLRSRRGYGRARRHRHGVGSRAVFRRPADER